MKRLCVAVSHHGYGHLAQTAPVLEALRRLDPGMEFILWTALPESALAERLDMPFEHLSGATDCNLVMRDAIRIDLPASLAAYREFHRDWPSRVEGEARRLDALRIDAMFSNVGYLPLAAAYRAGRPVAAMCSLNWADIFRHYLGHEAEAPAILDAMAEAYGGARVFLRPKPAMPMPDLANAVAIPPVVRLGRARRDVLAEKLGVTRNARLVLIGMGGIGYRPPIERWPRLPGIKWLVPETWRAAHPDAYVLERAGWPFRDILASVDALITKPGYGSFTEAAAAGLPVLTVARPDWPETRHLLDWLQAVGGVLEIEEAALASGDLSRQLETLWRLPKKPWPEMNGAAEAARILLEKLA